MEHSIEDAFAALHSLNIREPLRKFQPKIMLVAVDENGEIVKIEKLKKSPNVEDLHRFGDDCKGTTIFIADTENFQTIDSFRERVRKIGISVRKRLSERDH